MGSEEVTGLYDFIERFARLPMRYGPAIRPKVTPRRVDRHR
jgi:hypothetical protein